MTTHKGYTINVGVDVRQVRQRQPGYLGIIKDAQGRRVEILWSHGFNYIEAPTKKDCVKKCIAYIDHNL